MDPEAEDAFREMRTQEIIHAHRGRKADRFVAFLRVNDLASTPANLAHATRELNERAIPSKETAAMIRERLKAQIP